MSVWIVTREYDYEGSLILGVFSAETTANEYVANDPNPEPIYGVLTITEWPVDERG